jgi:hypothetical protein
MPRFWRVFCLVVALFALAFATPLGSIAAQQGQTPASSSQGPGSQLPNNDYGSGGHAVMQNDAAGAELIGTVYDSTGTVRHQETNTFTTTGGAEHKTEQRAFDFDFKGHLQLGLDYKYDLRGGLTFSDMTGYGLHGERVAEEVTNYRADGYEIKDWSLRTHQWSTNFTPYKTPLPATTDAQAPLIPTNTNIGVLFPRSYLPGETITGTLWPSAYAESFKSVPGLSEYTFPIQLYHLPDGSPEWSSLQIGVNGDGYFPVNPNGTFSLHIPCDWKGPLELKARQVNPLTGSGPADAQIKIDDPFAAPTLSNQQFPSVGLARLNEDIEDHLVNLWEDAFDLEETLDNLYAETTLDWASIFAVKDELDSIYGEIDAVEDNMSPEEVISLAQGMIKEESDFHAWLSKQPNLNAGDKGDLADSAHWAEFLHNEIRYEIFMDGWGPANPVVQPNWTNPVLTEGKLGVIGGMTGMYSIAPYYPQVHIDKIPITPLAATPNSWYFMPPTGLTAGEHNYIIDGPLFPETIFPFFYMTLTMTADDLHLHKGQSTTYHVTLDGLNGLPAGAWGGSSDPSDLVGSSEISAAQKAAGTSRKGYITLTITNKSRDVITMQDVISTLDASFFAPSGSFKVNGGIGAIKDGTFSIIGVARAFLEPEIGIGTPPGTSLSGGSSGYQPGTLSSNWLPPFSLNYDLASFTKSSFMTDCPGSSTAPTATTPCVESVINDIMPPKPNPQLNQVQDNSADSKKKLQDAEKRVKEAKEKEEAAFNKVIAADKEVQSAFKAGLDQADPMLQEKLKQAEEALEKAKEEKDKAAATQEATPTAENDNLLMHAQWAEAEAWSAADAARKEVIDGFDADTKKAYDEAVDDSRKAGEEWLPTENEKRAAYDALEKLQSTAGSS